jgi:hypothetical protein
MWTLAFGHHEDRSPTQGYAATRETAIYQCHLFDSVHTGSLSSVIIFRRGDTARVRSRGVHWRGRPILLAARDSLASGLPRRGWQRGSPTTEPCVGGLNGFCNSSS